MNVKTDNNLKKNEQKLKLKWRAFWKTKNMQGISEHTSYQYAFRWNTIGTFT